MTQATINLSKAADFTHEVHELLRHTRDDHVSGYDHLSREVKEQVNEAVDCLERVSASLRVQ